MKAKFTPKIKEQIANRDYNKCILCYDPPHSVHHVYYWLEANRWANRNDIDQWVTLCFRCHNLAHACKSWIGVRQECIDYLKNIYD